MTAPSTEPTPPLPTDITIGAAISFKCGMLGDLLVDLPSGDDGERVEMAA
jgi:hypothetical protein